MFKFFFKGLLSRWPLFTLGAVIIGAATAVLSAQTALSASAENEVHGLAHQLGKNMLVLPRAMDASRFYTMDFGQSTMPDQYGARIRSSPLAQHIRMVQERLYGNVAVGDTKLILVGERGAGGGDAKGAVIGTAAARLLKLRRGDTLTLNGVTVSISSIAQSAPDGLDMGVFTSLSAAQKILGQPGAVNALRLGGCWCRLDVPTLAGKVERLLPGSRAITVAGVLKAQKGMVAVVKSYSRVIQISAIGVIGILVVLLVSVQVRRQTRDVGLLLAIGTPPSWITATYVLQATIVGATGALGGHLFGGYLTTWLATRLVGLELAAPSGPVLTPILITVAVCTVAALLPAHRAARMDPTIVLSEV